MLVRYSSNSDMLNRLISICLGKLMNRFLCRFSRRFSVGIGGSIWLLVGLRFSW